MESGPPPLRRRLATGMLPRVSRLRSDSRSLLATTCVLELSTWYCPQSWAPRAFLNLDHDAGSSQADCSSLSRQFRPSLAGLTRWFPTEGLGMSSHAARLAWSDEEVEHLNAGEVALEDGGELLEEKVEDEDDAVSLDPEDAARGWDLGAG
jgi:hypothetical protein